MKPWQAIKATLMRLAVSLVDWGFRRFEPRQAKPTPIPSTQPARPPAPSTGRTAP